MTNEMLLLRSDSPKTGKRRPPTELEKAKAEAERARADLSAAQQRADESRAKLLKSKHDSKVRLRVTAVVMMTLALIKLGWQAANEPTPMLTPTVAQPMPKSAAAMTMRQSSASGDASVAPTEAQMERLRDAFHAFPEEDQPDVVREVNERYAGTDSTCPLAWNADGMPSLSLKDGSKPDGMMAKALSQCAKGVEKLRKERDAENARLTK